MPRGSYDSFQSNAHGGNSGAAMSSAAQMRSSVFDVDPAVKGGRVGGDDDKNMQYKPVASVVKAATPPRPTAVDISDYTTSAAGTVAKSPGKLTRQESSLSPAKAK